jgi:hypothetical protein
MGGLPVHRVPQGTISSFIYVGVQEWSVAISFSLHSKLEVVEWLRISFSSLGS